MEPAASPAAEAVIPRFSDESEKAHCVHPARSDRTDMKKGRLLGIDFGTVRHGLAVCDADGIIASPFDTYQRRDAKQDAAYFAKLIREENISGLVVGLPMHTGGEEGIKAKEARAFAQWLSDATGLPFEMWDERCTTAAAEDALRGAGLSHKNRKARRDLVAAQIILQSYLENNRLT